MQECVLYKKEKNGKVRCLACAHKCLIFDGKTGICGVRKNIGGKLYLLVYGKIVAENVDPIEKKPFYCFLPGSRAYSVGSVGCNFRCLWCQNFDISQASKIGKIFGRNVTPEEIIENALRAGCKSVAYTYNEPVIWIEFVKDVAELAKAKRLKNILVTNGYFSKESFEYIVDLIDAVNIDLKSFSDENYKKYCGAGLEPVLENVRRFYEREIHVELTTLIVPDVNDSGEELEKIAKFIASVDRNIPWHISRFFPMYKMLDVGMTPIESLERAYKIGKKYLKNVYVGNV